MLNVNWAGFYFLSGERTGPAPIPGPAVVYADCARRGVCSAAGSETAGAGCRRCSPVSGPHRVRCGFDSGSGAAFPGTSDRKSDHSRRSASPAGAGPRRRQRIWWNITSHSRSEYFGAFDAHTPFPRENLMEHAPARSWFASEDWLAVWLGLAVVLIALPTAAGFDLLGWVASAKIWLTPIEAVRPVSPKYAFLPGLVSLFLTYLLVLGLVGALRGGPKD